MKWEWLLPINYILLYISVRVFSRWRADRERLATDGKVVGCMDRDLCLEVATCLVTLGILVSTELLSVFQLISRRSLMLFWGGLDALLVLAILAMSVTRILRGRSHPVRNVEALTGRVRANVPVAIATTILLLTMAVLGAISIRLAMQTVPYNWDSMTYHLGRVAHWHQNGSVAHYASNIDRQILSPPLGEFLMLQVYTMAGGMDRSVNLVQCAAYLVCAVLVVRLTRRLGVRHWMACLSGVLFMTMPIAFAESLTTQVDLVSCVYLLVFVTMAMDLWQQETPIILGRWPRTSGVTTEDAQGDTATPRSHNLIQILCMGLCIGFGYLCKPSVCLGMVIFLIPVVMSCVRRRDAAAVVFCSVMMAAVAAALVAAPELARMYGTYHAFSSPQAGARQMVGSADLRLLLLNFLKSLAFNLPNAWMPGLSDGIKAFLYTLAAMLNVDLNDAAISENGQDYRLNAVNDYGHDTAVNAGIYWLWLICLVLLVAAWIVRFVRHQQRMESMRGASVYLGTTIAAFVLFWLVVRWEPYEVRYMLPYLALICAAVPLAMQEIVATLLPALHTRTTQGILVATAVGILIPTMILMRDVVDYHEEIVTQQGERPDGYYQWRRGELGPQYQLASAILDAGYSSVGLYCGGDDYEYPLWSLLGRDVQIEHVMVENETAQYEDTSYAPDAIIFLDRGLPAEYDSQGYLSYHDYRYVVAVTVDEGHLLLTRE